MKSLRLLVVLVGLLGITLFISGAVIGEPCQPSVSVARPDWWVLANTYGSFDLIAYPIQGVVFGLNEQQANTLKNARQVGLAPNGDGSYRLCSFR